MEPLEIQVEDTVEFRLKSDAQIFKDLSAHLAGTDAVFCMPERLAQCEGVLRTISTSSSLVMPVTRFLPLPELLYRLANSSKEGPMIPSSGVSERELESERFLFKSGLSCPWHEAMTETNTCSSATSSRLCFTVLDLCCQYYGVTLVGGKHMPRAVETDPVGKDWNLPMVKPRVVSRNTVVRRPGEFASQDVRLTLTPSLSSIILCNISLPWSSHPSAICTPASLTMVAKGGNKKS